MINDVYIKYHIKYMLLWSAEGHSIISQIIIWRSHEGQIQTQDHTRDGGAEWFELVLVPFVAWCDGIPICLRSVYKWVTLQQVLNLHRVLLWVAYSSCCWCPDVNQLSTCSKLLWRRLFNITLLRFQNYVCAELPKHNYIPEHIKCRRIFCVYYRLSITTLQSNSQLLFDVDSKSGHVSHPSPSHGFQICSLSLPTLLTQTNRNHTSRTTQTTKEQPAVSTKCKTGSFRVLRRVVPEGRRLTPILEGSVIQRVGWMQGCKHWALCQYASFHCGGGKIRNLQALPWTRVRSDYLGKVKLLLLNAHV